MTQLWDDKGRLVGATVILVEPNHVIKTGERIQLAVSVPGKASKAQQALAKKIGSDQNVWLKESTGLKTDNETLDVTEFSPGDNIKISGVTKGKGFAGVVKRHGFAGWPASHGHSHQRRPGSIGAQRPQRVVKGQKMAGRMGGVNLTVRGSKVLAVKSAEHLLVVSGPVPGPARGRVIIQGTNR